MRLFRSAVLVAALAGAVGAEGYNFLFWDGQSFRVVASEEAFRWDESEFPLRFRMLENDNLPAEIGITQESWNGIVKRSLQRWTDIPTSDAMLMLEDPTVAADRADASDGVNTIGFTSDESFRDSWVTATANWSIAAGKITQCDVKVSPYFVKNWAPQDPERLLEVVITHEIGHCLGLLHTEPHPMPLWTGLPVAKDAGFLPDPVMSYSNSYGLELPPDDTVAVSLLYPAGDFVESRGSIRGTVDDRREPGSVCLRAVGSTGRARSAGPSGSRRIHECAGRVRRRRAHPRTLDAVGSSHAGDPSERPRFPAEPGRGS